METRDRPDEIEGMQTQILFREINERIHELNSDRAVNGEFLCECVRRDCVATISPSPEEYEAVRRIPTRFVVLPGHEAPQIERIVETTERYTIVEKFGAGGSAAVRLDPRRRQSVTHAGAELGISEGTSGEVVHAGPA